MRSNISLGLLEMTPIEYIQSIIGYGLYIYVRAPCIIVPPPWCRSLIEYTYKQAFGICYYSSRSVNQDNINKEIERIHKYLETISTVKNKKSD